MSVLAVVEKSVRVLHWRSLGVDLDQHLLRVAGAVVPTSEAEFGLARLLIRNRNVPISKDAILSALFGPNHGRSLLQADIFVVRLRRSLALAGLTDAIMTVAGRGYAMLDDHRSVSTAYDVPPRDLAVLAA